MMQAYTIASVFNKTDFSVTRRLPGSAHSCQKLVLQSAIESSDHGIAYHAEDVVKVPSINAFKNRLDRHWGKATFLYNYKAQINTSSAYNSLFKCMCTVDPSKERSKGYTPAAQTRIEPMYVYRM